MTRRWGVRSALVWMGLAVVLGGLALLAYQGVYNRYWADDWCYDADVVHRGLIGALQGYFDTTTYATNRFSLTLFSGFLTPLWVTGVQLLPLAVILAWLGGLFWNARLLVRMAILKMDRKTSLLAAASILTFILWLAPNQFQILMWRTGMLTYSAPLICMTYLFGVILRQMLEQRKAWPGVVAAGLLAFLAGGFGEVGCALLLTGLGLALVLVLVFSRRRVHSHRVILTLAVALVGGLAAMAVVLLSPMNEPRRIASYGPPASLMDVPWMALKFGYFYVRTFLSLNRWMVLALGAGGLVLGIIGSKKAISARQLIAGLGITASVVYLLIVAVHVPAAYVENSQLGESRALLVPAYVMVLGILVGAVLIGCAFRRWKPEVVESPRPWMAGMAALLALVPIFYAGLNIPAAIQPLAFFQKRAQAWDVRDLTVREAKLAGQMTVDVHEIDSYAGVLEMKPAPNWVNHCAASFYGMQEIRATLPWNP